ncbi:AraC family transcriptional regulator [Mesorhizobium caraganae]|uniref:AraC family transcriptional regulator n=1 Tax=Mesorhizobium caraganae TaxID=483206 RepID=UPI001939F691|nr:AraC family transcriptional regulator [Mesorhizobium caraganae]MBM2716023.1 AraC family transcriptional regulator [Mesorhizobium caraganae]
MNAPANINSMKSLATPKISAAVDRPFDLVVLVLPGFSHLALHAYIEPFRIANTVSRLPLFRWRIAGIAAGPVEGANGLSVAVDVAIDELVFGSDDRRPNQLAIVTGEPVERQLTPELNGFLRTMARRGVPISAFGTATWLLARTGLLAGTRCTIHWSRLAAFAEVFNQPRISDSLFVKDGQYSTCAGELAAFDLAVDLIGSHAERGRYAARSEPRKPERRRTGYAPAAFPFSDSFSGQPCRLRGEGGRLPLWLSGDLNI